VSTVGIHGGVKSEAARRKETEKTMTSHPRHLVLPVNVRSRQSSRAVASVPMAKTERMLQSVSLTPFGSVQISANGPSTRTREVRSAGQTRHTNFKKALTPGCA
jgi:hypothetical protein